MSNKNEVFEYLIGQLRQQVNNNKCEDLAHEVQSLKNQLRDMSELVDELLGTITLMNGKSSRRKEDSHECYLNWRLVNGKAHEVCIKCGVTKAEECEHEWCVETFYGTRVSPTYCRKCGATK